MAGPRRKAPATLVLKEGEKVPCVVAANDTAAQAEVQRNSIFAVGEVVTLVPRAGSTGSSTYTKT